MGALEFWSKLIGSLAWPAAIFGLGWLLRKQLRKGVEEIIERMIEIKGPGGTGVKLDKPTQKAAKALVNPPVEKHETDAHFSGEGGLTVEAEVTAGGQVGDGPKDQTVTPGSVRSSAQVGTPTVTVSDPGAELRRRAQVTLIMDAAARWGWDQGRTSKSYTHPLVEWDSNGEPVIVGSTGDSEYIAYMQGQAGVLPVGSGDSAKMTESATVIEKRASDGGHMSGG